MQQAFKHDFLLNGILSLAASHVANEVTATRHVYSVTAAEYLEFALSEFRPSLNAITDDNAHAVYIFGIVLCTGLFSQLESSVASMTWLNLVDKLDSIYQCLSGVGQVIATSLELLRASPLNSILTRLEAKQAICPNEDVSDALLLLQETVDRYCATLQPLTQQVLRYNKMVDDLKACWLHRVFVIDWLTNTGKDFQVGLRHCGVMETLLLAYWGVALCSLQQYWFMKDLGRTIARMALEQMDSVDSQFRQCVSWVEEQIVSSQQQT